MIDAVSVACGGALATGNVVSLSCADASGRLRAVVRVLLLDGSALVFRAVLAGDGAVTAAARLHPRSATDAGSGVELSLSGAAGFELHPEGRVRAWLDGSAGAPGEAGPTSVELEASLLPWAAADGGARLFTVEGELRTPGGGEGLPAAGQLRVWRPQPADVQLVRELDAWFPSGRGVALQAVRPSSRGGHDREEVAASVAEGDPGAGAEGDGPGRHERGPDRDMNAIEDPRLSTTYRGDGSVRRASLELWPTEDADYARRAAGEALAGATVVTDPIGSGRKAYRLRHDVAFLTWRMEGEEGTGTYTLVRRLPGR